jgi:hypothetical protein
MEDGLTGKADSESVGKFQAFITDPEGSVPHSQKINIWP